MMVVEAPSGWQTHALGDLFDFHNGVNADKAAYGSGVPFANVLEVITHEALTDRLIPGRIKLSPALIARYQLRYGDLLFNRTSETQDEVGLASVYVGDAATVFGGFVFRGRPKTNLLDTAYSKYALRAHSVRQQIVARGQGGIRANIGQRDLKAVRVIVPPKAEQRKIAGVLTDIDRQISLLERLVAKKGAIKQGMMQRLLPGASRLPGFSKPWRTVHLRDVATMSSGGTPPSTTPRYYGGDIPWVSISDMTGSRKYVHQTEKTLSGDGLACSAATLYADGVVLYAMYASLGECALPVGRVSSSQAILGILPSQGLDREYLYYALCSRKRQVKKLGQHGTQSNLNAGIVRDFVLELPEIEEQRAIAAALASVDDAIDLLKARLQKAAAIRQGLMQELLTGRARLPVTEKSTV